MALESLDLIARWYDLSVQAVKPKGLRPNPGIELIRKVDLGDRWKIQPTLFLLPSHLSL